MPWVGLSSAFVLFVPIFRDASMLSTNAHVLQALSRTVALPCELCLREQTAVQSLGDLYTRQQWRVLAAETDTVR